MPPFRPPGYRPAATRCCATCNEGYTNVDGSRHCSWHCGMRVGRGYVCDDWTPEDRGTEHPQDLVEEDL